MDNSNKNRQIWGILFFAWSSLIIVFSIISNNSIEKIGLDNSGFRWDYLEHLFVFILFTILYLQWRKADSVKSRVAGLIICGILLASLTEFFQLFIPSRSFNYLDLLFNIAGLPAGVLMIKLLYKIRLSSLT